MLTLRWFLDINTVTSTKQLETRLEPSREARDAAVDFDAVSTGVVSLRLDETAGSRLELETSPGIQLRCTPVFRGGRRKGLRKGNQ